MDLLARISIDRAVRFGKPCVRGTRLTVGDVLGTLAAGSTEAELLEDFPQLTHEDVLACLPFGAEREKRLITAPAAVGPRAMGQRLLLDENLSERLLPLLIERFPSSSHVRLVGLVGASDTAIWEWAREQTTLLVTKDEDFLDLSVARAFPPKVVCLAIGNASNAATAALLLQQAEATV